MIIKVKRLHTTMEAAYRHLRGLRDWDSVSNTITENYYLYRNLLAKNISQRIQKLYNTLLIWSMERLNNKTSGH